MDELINFVNFLTENFTEAEIKSALFLIQTDVISYRMMTEKKKGDNNSIEQIPTNVIELNTITTCSRIDREYPDLFEKIYLHFVGYTLKEDKTTWKLNLNKLDVDLKYKCDYCKVDYNVCPIKLAAYIKKCVDDNQFDVSKLAMEINARFAKAPIEYEPSEENLKYIVGIIDSLVKDPIDIAAAEMIISNNLVEIEKEKDGNVFYNYLDLEVKNTNSFFINLKGYYEKRIMLKGELHDIWNNFSFSKNYSYMFNCNPFEIAAFIKYYADLRHLFPIEIIEAVLNKKKFNNDFKPAYYKQYIKKIGDIECQEEEKERIKSILTYIRNYFYMPELPYIQFNLALFTKNTLISDDIINTLSRFAHTFSYLGNNGIMWIDATMLVRRTKDSLDMISQIERFYVENDVLVFENFEKMNAINEYRADALFFAVEKFRTKNKRTMTIFVDKEDIIKNAAKNFNSFLEDNFTEKITLKDHETESIREKIINKLKNVSVDIDDEFVSRLDKYIEGSFNPEKDNEQAFINETCDLIVFNKFSDIGVNKRFRGENIPEPDNSRTIDDIMKDINSLVGLVDAKAYIQEITKFVKYNERIGHTKDINLNMIFKGNSGTGKTTLAKYLAELLFKLGYVKENKYVEVTSKDLIGTHLGETAPKTQAIINNALDGVLLIDEAYTIMSSKGGTSSYPQECIATLCKAMDEYKDRLVIIFAGYTEEMNNFINANQGLMSRIAYEVEFPDFTKEELLEVFRREADKNGFEIEDGVEEKVNNLIQKNKIGRNFGNARFVTNLFERLVITHASNCDRDEDLKKIMVSDVDEYNATKYDKERSIDDILKDLNSLVGLNKVKDTLNGFVSLIEFNKKVNKMNEINMHMIFKGNAGTGKTTVARLLAEIYYNLGYVKKNKLVEVQSRDLIGEYVGQTAPKTNAVIESALDGVLFIDEAYSIIEQNGATGSFSAECIAAILKAMEDYRGRLIVVFAGYTQEMRDFRDFNPGLKSRIGYEIDFDDYTIDELMEIFDKKIYEKGFTIDSNARDRVKEIVISAKQVENFGNGRFIDNLIQKIIIEHAKNTRGIDDMNRLLNLKYEDIADVKAEESKKKIGF